MSKEKLKPCPFCGNVPFSGPSEGRLGSWDIDCSTKQGQCFIPINNFPFKTEVEAIEAWNKREGVKNE